MKKIIFAFIFVFSSIQFAQAQKLDFGIKGGINYNSESFVDVRDQINNEGTKSKTGFHAGLWSRIKLSETGFYIRPEIVYTALKSEVTASGTTFADYDFQKRTSMIHMSAAGAQVTGEQASILARGESLTAHARSAEYRLTDKN